MMTEARLKAESHSLSAKRQILIIAALVTESLHPVRQPIKRQNNTCTMNAFLRLTLNTLSTIGMQAIKPAKCVLQYELFDKENVLLNIGETTLAWIDAKTGRLVSLKKVLPDVYEKMLSMVEA